MITLGIVAIVAVVVLARRPAMPRLRRRDHEPRAIALVLALPPAPPTHMERFMAGDATLSGRCTWCEGPWEPCALGCVRRDPASGLGGYPRKRPPPTLMPGPGARRLG